MLNEGILVKESDKLKFSEDYIFSSPSTAAMVIQGRTANGWIDWKDKHGKTLDALKRK